MTKTAKTTGNFSKHVDPKTTAKATKLAAAGIKKDAKKVVTMKKAEPKAERKDYGFRPEQKIIPIVKENPRRPGTKAADWAAMYFRKGMTVGRYLEKGGDRGYLRYDVNKGVIKVA